MGEHHLAGLTLSTDGKSATLDTTAFDTNFEKMLALGYRDFKFPVPACSTGGSCNLKAAAGIDSNATWVFANSTGFVDGWLLKIDRSATPQTLCTLLLVSRPFSKVLLYATDTRCLLRVPEF
jgi:hypothetical protein